MVVINVLLGALLLLFGRRLFWLFVAAAGFAAGIFFARDYFELESELMIFAIALLAGIIGALLSVLLQKIAIALSGFAAGGYLGAYLFQALDSPNLAWVGFVVGGVLGALLLLVVFDWALIVLSSLMGAALLAQGVALNEDSTVLLFVAGFVIGVVVQALQLRKVREVAAPAPGGTPPRP